MRSVMGMIGALALVLTNSVAAQTNNPDLRLAVSPPPGFSIAVTSKSRTVFKSNDIQSAFCDVELKNNVPTYLTAMGLVQNWNDRLVNYSIQESEVWILPGPGATRSNFDENYPLRPPEQSYAKALSVLFKISDKFLSVRCQSGARHIEAMRSALEAIVRGINFEK